MTQGFGPGSAAIVFGLASLIACSASPEDQASGARPGVAGTGGALSFGGSSNAGGSAATPSLGGKGGGASTEACNGFDDDLDGVVDEGCTCTPGATQSCFPFAPQKENIGPCKSGEQSCSGKGEIGFWLACTGAVGPEPEQCENGIDDDCDGKDDPCTASGGAGGGGGSGGGGATAGAGGAGSAAGTSGGGAGGTSSGGAGGAGGSGGTSCVPSTEICGNGIDEDCDGQDKPCVVCNNIFLFGDCKTVSCPPSAPYPKSCNVFFTPGDDRGCVASVPTSPIVYFQAGDQCDAGLVTGSLCCSPTPQPALNQQTCPINKPIQYHVSSKNECPPIKG